MDKLKYLKKLEGEELLLEIEKIQQHLFEISPLKSQPVRQMK